MGRIAITEAAFEAIAKTLPIGSVAPAASTKRYGRNHRNSTSTCKNRSSSTRARQTTELARKLALRPSQWRRKNTLIQSDIGKTT